MRHNNLLLRKIVTTVIFSSMIIVGDFMNLSKICIRPGYGNSHTNQYFHTHQYTGSTNINTGTIRPAAGSDRWVHRTRKIDRTGENL